MIEGVYDDKRKCEERLYFKLEDWTSSDVVIIKVVRENGCNIDAPFICSINKTSGKIRREEDVNNKIGFDLDELGRVKVEVE